MIKYALASTAAAQFSLPLRRNEIDSSLVESYVLAGSALSPVKVIIDTSRDDSAFVLKNAFG